MMKADPFHDGERYVQERTGERDVALRVGVAVGEIIPSRAIPFLAQQEMLVLGSADQEGTVWASLLFGTRGMVSSEDGRCVVIDRTRIDINCDDPLWRNLRVGVDVGLLAIELASRRRLRMNGVVTRFDEQRIEVSIRAAYSNCPKYIQRRHVHSDSEARRRAVQTAVYGVSLDEARTQWIEQADTLFVASRNPAHGVDVSHRGGAPGFVRVVHANRLRIPDYKGNSMFNTLGNFVVDNRAGLVLLDFERARILQMTGTTAVHFDQQEDPNQPTGGTGRYWDFDVTHWLELPMLAPRAWELLDFSTCNLRPLV